MHQVKPLTDIQACAEAVIYYAERVMMFDEGGDVLRHGDLVRSPEARPILRNKRAFMFWLVLNGIREPEARPTLLTIRA